MTAYIYIHGNRVVVNKQKEPQARDFVLCSEDFMIVESEWQKGHMEVENAELMDDEDPKPLIVIDLESDYDNVYLTLPGSMVEYNNKQVTKIL